MTRPGLRPPPRPRPVLAATLVAALAVVLAVTAVPAPPPALGELKLAVQVKPLEIPVGKTTSSKLKFVITNTGGVLQGLTRGNTSFELELSAGSGAEDLVTKKDVQKIRVGAGSVTSKWTVTPDPDKTHWKLEPQAGRKVALPQGESVSFELVSVIATVPGHARLQVTATVLDQHPGPYPLAVEKSEPRADIRSFTAQPGLLAPGTRTELRWRVTFPDPHDPNNQVKLNGREVPADGEMHCKPVVDTTYTLEAQPASVEKKVRVYVKQPRWYTAAGPSASGQSLVPTVLFGVPSEPVLYGIFVQQDGTDPSLWKTTDPIAGEWTEVQAAGLPAQRVTSSGVFFRGALYLIGGSTVFADSFSNEVWRLDPADCANGNCAWTQLDPPPPWTPRQGQTALVRGEENGGEIWVIGGYDRLSNPLQDVWTFDGTKWTGPLEVPWPARGLPAAGVAGDRGLVMVGGFSGYQQEPLDDLWVYDGAWSRKPIRSPVAKLRALSLVESSIDGNLYLNAAYIDQGELDQGSWLLQQDRSAWSKNPYGAAFGGLDSSYFYLQTVEWNGALWATSTGGSTDWPQQLEGNTALDYFVPPPLQTEANGEEPDDRCPTE